MKVLLVFTFLGLSIAQIKAQDSIFIRSIYDEALLRGRAYEDLRELCKNIGARLTGSAEAEMSIKWSEQKMKSYGFDTVYLQKITIPHWERGNKESAWISGKNNQIIKLNILALGGSIGTNGLIDGELIEFKSLEELKKASKEVIENKIVFINQPMDASQIITFKAYGACYPVRGNGAVEAAKLGAKAVLIRSLGLPTDEYPHTGAMYYEDQVKRIPAAAVSTRDAELVSSLIQNKEKLTLHIEMDCRNFPDTNSFNVIGELKGTKKKAEIITVGGHLDSWDAGEGAHDDGAGVIHSLEALRILKMLQYKPKHTLRVVFFMNEENGNRGGIGYAELSKQKGEKHIAALESDRGGFAPRGFSCDGNEEQLKLLQSFEKVLSAYNLHVFEKGYGGVDIGPLKEQYNNIALFGFVPDSQRYFDFHHAPSDIFENVNKRELELGAASVSAMLYLLDQNLK